MRTLTMIQRLLLAGLVLAAAMPTAGAQEAGGTSFEVFLGAWATDDDGNLELVDEYGTDGSGPDLGLNMLMNHDWGQLLLETAVQSEDDVELALDFDVQRMVRSHTSYVKLPHRLIHDPLENLNAATTHGRAVRSTDLDPGSEYEISFALGHHRTELQLPSLPNLTLAVDLRDLHREGTRQILATSHCDACHITGQDRAVDQRDTEATLEALWAWRSGTVRASFAGRELQEEARPVTLLFDNALQPELRTPIFDNRLQWDSAQGPQVIDDPADLEKQRARLEVDLPRVLGAAMSFSGTWAETENTNQNLTADFTGFVARIARPIAERLNVRWNARTYTLDNDTVFVDTAEPVSIAGPHVGRTYRDAYGIDPDWTRTSALDRDVIESNLDFGWRLGSREKGDLTLSWDYRSTDREHYEVAPGETETVENVLGLSWRARPARGWKLDVSGRHGEVDNPFMFVNGSHSINTSITTTSPFDPRADQYFTMRGEMIAETTASPASWDEAKLNVSRVLSKTMVSGSYRFWSGDNDEGDLTNWSRTNQSATLTVTYTPEERWQLYAAAAWHDAEVDTPASIALFDG